MQYLLILLALLSGCGLTDEDKKGGPAVFDDIDNSQNSSFQNEWGYFGDGTIFGQVKVEGKWSYYYIRDDSNNTGTSISYSGSIANPANSAKVSFGVSKDGNQINLSTGEFIYITTASIYRTTSTGADCYRVKLVDADNNDQLADACPMDL